MCLACWHFRREAFLENEFHVICACPEYTAARQEYIASGARLNQNADVIAALSCNSKSGAELIGKLCIRIRQKRRRLKLLLEHLSEAVANKSFACRRAAWRLRELPACRHGILFARMPAQGCNCMRIESSSADDWEGARFMPSLSHDLKVIVAVPFEKSSFVRLACLQAKARQLGW